LDEIENLVTDLPSRIVLKTQKIIINEAEEWIGNQSIFRNFERLPESVKLSSMQKFHLKNADDMGVSFLIHHLRPCVCLEILRLETVELNGDLANTTEAKLSLPRLHDFRATLPNYPNVRLRELLEGILFFKKSQTESLELDKLVEYNWDVFIGVAGWRKIAMIHEFGEFVFDATMDDYRLLPQMLQAINASSTCSLKCLTLTSRAVASSDLSDMSPPR